LVLRQQLKRTKFTAVDRTSALTQLGNRQQRDHRHIARLDLLGKPGTILRWYRRALQLLWQ
jgi:hypothetical protein